MVAEDLPVGSGGLVHGLSPFTSELRQSGQSRCGACVCGRELEGVRHTCVKRKRIINWTNCIEELSLARDLEENSYRSRGAPAL